VEWIPSKEDYNTQKLWMITEEVMHSHAQPIYYYKATKELMKLASGMDTIIQLKEN
jgi:hypothetical protein